MAQWVSLNFFFFLNRNSHKEHIIFLTPGGEKKHVDEIGAAKRKRQQLNSSTQTKTSEGICY